MSLWVGLNFPAPFQIEGLGVGFEKPGTISMAAGFSLSALPAEVIIAILSLLPIAEAVRTSILSSSLRHLWRSIPNLAFDLHDDRDFAAIDHVLGLHSGPIQSFSLSVVDYHLNPNDIDRWLSADPLHLRSLTLDLWGPLCYYGCLVGFPVLETLDLSGCISPYYDSSSRSSDLIIDCPLLQKLTLFDVERRYVRICAPNLRSFIFEGDAEGFALASAPLLTTVVINLHDNFGDDETKELKECNLIKTFGGAPNIEKLTLLGYSLYFLGNFGIPDRIPDTFERLKVLSFTADFNSAKEIFVLLCLLRSAPNLHEIKIQGLEFDPETLGLGHEFWQAQNHLKLPKLQTLELTQITCVEPMLGFIDYILPKAPELEKMEINISPCCKKYGSIAKLSSSKELVRHWRSSTRARILFTGELSECSITSSGSNAPLSVGVRTASQEELNEQRGHIESKRQRIEDRVLEDGD